MNFEQQSAPAPSRVTRFLGARLAPGLPSTLGRSLTTFDRKGSGKPPAGCPIMPCRNSTTLRAASISSACQLHNNTLNESLHTSRSLHRDKCTYHQGTRDSG